MTNSILASSVALLLATLAVTHAGEMRSLQPIRTPDRQELAAPEGYEQAPEIRPVDREAVEEFMRQLAEQWNTAGLTDLLSDDFHDKSIFDDSMHTFTKAPPDARLRLLSLQSVHTLRQMLGEDPEYGRICLSIVEVRARTEISYDDPEQGFVRVEGVNEFILKVRQTVE